MEQRSQPHSDSWVSELLDGISPHSEEMHKAKTDFWNNIILPEIQEEYGKLYLEKRDWSKGFENYNDYLVYCQEYQNAARAWVRNRPKVRYVDGCFYYMTLSAVYFEAEPVSPADFRLAKLTPQELVSDMQTVLDKYRRLVEQRRKVGKIVGVVLVALWALGLVTAVLGGRLETGLIWSLVFLFATIFVLVAAVLLERLKLWEDHD